MEAVPVLLKRTEPIVEIRSILLWQLLAVFVSSAIAEFFFSGFFGVMLGGVLVAASTWHINRSVIVAEGDRSTLLRSAGLRFVLFLMLMGVELFILQMQPILLIAGMVVAYVALYIRSLLLIVKKVKGDRLV